MKHARVAQLILNVWLSRTPKFLFHILCFFECFYKIGFYIHQKIRILVGGYTSPTLKVISIGNLSTGGTGKSVLMRYLAQKIGPAECALISRGYGGTFEKTGTSHFVSDGHAICASVTEAGDEALMLARTVAAPIIVGKSRKESVQRIEEFNKNRSCCHRIRYVLLDDGYQNHELKKDVEILLLDARQAFGNDHCLPAGPLRERDVTRADIIILTHASALSDMHHQLLKNMMTHELGKRVFSAAHGISGVYDAERTLISLEQCKKEKVFILAAIGSFSGFKSTVQKLGCSIVGECQFQDHYAYTIEELMHCIKKAQELGSTSIMTTEKDWVKISPLLAQYSHNELAKALPWFMVSIGFQFLVPEEEILFFDLIKERLEL